MLSDTLADASEDIKDALKRYPDMYLPWHHQEAKRLARELRELSDEVGNNPDYWKFANPRTGQHQVVIDGHILSNKHANFVVEAIEQQRDDSFNHLAFGEPDEEERVRLAPGVLSLAEVIHKVLPSHDLAGIYFDGKGEAYFSYEPLGDLNPSK